MDKTPFDNEIPEPPVVPPQVVPPQIVPPAPPAKKTPKWVFIAPLLLLLFGGSFFLAAHFRRQAEIQAQEAKLAALRQELKKTVLEDNALVMEMLDDGALEHITFAEFFKRAEKNKEARDVLIRKLRATETGPYGEQIGKFVKLMERENEWVRAEEAVSRAGLDVSEKWESYKRINDRASEEAGAVSQARRDYESAPYGEDYDEVAALNYARTRLKSVSGEATSAFDEWKEASDTWKRTKSSAAVIIADWMLREPLDYPNIAPKRPILELLVNKKADYVGKDSGANSAVRKNEKIASGKATAPSVIGAAPDATPKAPQFPTRVRSTKPLEGELYPETRTDEITEEYPANMGDEDLRLAINEMYARYGMTFRDKSYQANFEGKSWYKPDDRWTTGQIERAMTARERQNLKVLIAEREARTGGEE